MRLDWWPDLLTCHWGFIHEGYLEGIMVILEKRPIKGLLTSWYRMRCKKGVEFRKGRREHIKRTFHQISQQQQVATCFFAIAKKGKKKEDSLERIARIMYVECQKIAKRRRDK